MELVFFGSNQVNLAVTVLHWLIISLNNQYNCFRSFLNKFNGNNNKGYTYYVFAIVTTSWYAVSKQVALGRKVFGYGSRFLLLFGSSNKHTRFLNDIIAFFQGLKSQQLIPEAGDHDC